MPKSIHFPRIKRVSIQNYGLYPGPGGAGGLDWSFAEGTTVGVGINGLGKTTFLNALLLGLVGTQRLPKSDTLGLGSGRFELTKATRVRYFAERVSDRAENGTLELWFELGRKQVYIRRRLRDLAIQHLRIGRLNISDPQDDRYLDLVAEEAGLQNGYQFFVIVNFLLFFLEGRTSLLWDRTSQFEMLRVLFVDDALAKELADLNSEMIDLDSDMRNVRAVLNKLDKDYGPQVEQEQAPPDLEAELNRLVSQLSGVDENLQRMMEEQLERFTAVQNLEERKYRLEVELGELEQAVRAVHDEYLQDISPEMPATYRVLMASLTAGTGCGVCGSRDPGVAERAQKDLATGRCPVCHSDKNAQEHQIKKPGAAMKLEQQLNTLESKRTDLRALEKELKSASQRYESFMSELRAAQQERSTVQAQVMTKQAEMPLPQDELQRIRRKISETRLIISDKKAQLVRKRTRYVELVEKANQDIASSTEAVCEVFSDYAQHFLTEKVELEYGQVSVKVAQELPEIQLPSFTVKMTSGVNPDTPLPRPTQDSVSESQREFLELAFRMALMSVATRASNQGMLVMETPEASLDEVFIAKAGGMLRMFAGESSRRGAQVVVTCNLSGANMIQALLSDDGKLRPKERKGRLAHVINFLDIAAKSAAYREYESEYNKAFKKATGL